MDLDLAKRVALVTGSSRGTGAIIAGALAQEGATILIHSLDQSSGEDIVADLKNQGRTCHLVHGDIRSDDGALALANAVGELDLAVDILVNNFGAAMPSRWGRSSIDTWIEAFQTNLFSAVRLIDHFIGQMKEKGWGRVIQIGTIGSTSPNPRMPAYYTAKAALAASTISLMKDLKDTGITVNTVSPGLILTPEVEKYFLSKASKYGGGDTWDDIEAEVSRLEMPNPIGRIARRQEIADLVTFLASSRADFINGQNIRIDGGAIDIVS